MTEQEAAKLHEEAARRALAAAEQVEAGLDELVEIGIDHEDIDMDQLVRAVGGNWFNLHCTRSTMENLRSRVQDEPPDP